MEYYSAPRPDQHQRTMEQWKRTRATVVCATVIRMLFRSVLIVIVAAPVLRAQQIDFEQFPVQPLPDTAAPLVPSYGFNDDEFSIGAYIGFRPARGPNATPRGMGDVWDSLRAYNIKVVEVREGMQWNLFGWDSIINNARGRNPATGRWDERVILSSVPWDYIGWGRQIEFYPFDSAETYLWPCKFLNRAGGAKLANPTVLFGGRDSSYEQVYSNANTTPNQTILSELVMGYDSVYQKYNWRSQSVTDDSVVRRGEEMWIRTADHDLSKRALWFVVTAHLFNPQTDGGGGAIDSDSLLVVEIWNEVPKYSGYIRGAGDTVWSAPSDTSLLYATILVRKDSLNPVDPVNPNYAAYREIAYRVDMIDGANGRGGAWNPLNTAHRFDVRVRWTGREKIALRSIAIRDSAAQLLHGKGQASLNYRQELERAFDFAMRGPDATRTFPTADTNAPLRTDRLTRLYSGDEGYLTQYAAWNYIDSMLYRLYPDPNPRPGDTTSRGVRAWRAQYGPYRSQYVTTSQQEISVESYLYGIDFALLDALRMAGPGDTADFPHIRLGLPWHIYGIPSIAEHNGGRYFNPRLNLTGSIRDSVNLYTRAFQRMSLGANISGHSEWPYSENLLMRLANAAWASRRTGRRVIQWPGTFMTNQIQWRGDSINGFTRDTICSHVIEPAELRAIINLGLCYGSRGIHYGYLGTTPNQYGGVYYLDAAHPAVNDYSADWGAWGPYDTCVADRYDTLELRPPAWQNDPNTVDILTNHWTGWGMVRTEMRWLHNVWLPAISAELRMLKWRDAYSMHFAVPQIYMTGYGTMNHLTYTRPLAATEIVQSVTAVDRYGRVDPPMETYVELGLFDAQKDSLGYDVHHLLVVNRRTFEPTMDIDPASLTGRIADSLAESRTISIRFRLTHPDPTQYNFIRVQEIVPDTTRLPWADVPRQGLDTILRGDSAIALQLRSAGAALLRVTFCQPNDSLAVGDIRFNGGRRLAFDGRFWYAVYSRPLTFWTPPNKTVPTTQSVVYYRRSLPVDPATGAIRWDPRPQFELLLTDTSNARWYMKNRFPSLTVRADSTRLGDTVVTAVWTCYSTGNPGHVVLTRNIRSNGGDGTPELSSIDSVGFAHGTSDTLWGVPVVSRLHGGEMFAWGDAQAGILARFRQLKTGLNWWQSPWTYSVPDSVSWINTIVTGPGCYPSMPAFAHVGGRDSSVAIVWQQSGSTSWPQIPRIEYARLVHQVNAGAPRVMVTNRMRVSQNDGKWHRHPSIDMTQDVWYGAQEGVTWESHEYFHDALKDSMTVRPRVHFSSLWTETSRACTTGGWRPFHDCIEPPLQWTYNTLMLPPEPVANYHGASAIWQYPNTSSPNTRYIPSDSSRKILFSIAISHGWDHPMRQAMVEYATNFIWPQPKAYTHNGHYPNGSASGVKQSTRHAALFQRSADSTMHGMAGTLETTREYFAKERPRGYMAHGRQVHFRISDSLATAITGMLHDVWFAGDAGAGAVKLAERSGTRPTDSLPMVYPLFRSDYFRAHDSVTIGCTLRGLLTGDRGGASGMRVEFVAELVDSATDQPIAMLDSFAISPADTLHDGEIERGFDLLSSTYYVRLRIEPVGATVESVPYASLYPVEEMSEWIEEEPLAKVRRSYGASASGRLSAFPNPVEGSTEIRFSVPRQESVQVILFDWTGREIVRLLDGEMMEAGRYALDLDASNLSAGAYIVELRHGTMHVIEKIVVLR